MVGVSNLGSFDDFSVGSIMLFKNDVFFDGGGEENGFLLYCGYMVLELVEIERIKVVVV